MIHKKVNYNCVTALNYVLIKMGVNYMKKLMSLLLLICLIVSLIFNFYQYKSIRSYQDAQNQNNEEVKGCLGSLLGYTDKIDFATINEDKIRTCLSITERMNTLVRNSTYKNNQDIRDCFNDLNNVFTGMTINKIRTNGEQIKLLLKSTINTNNMEINPTGCKKLSEFIRSTD